jgi:two-component system OmpR family response regulator
VTRILVADDDPSVLDTVRYALEQEEFEVDTVTDGEAALAAIRTSDYDVVILNVMLPKLYGTDVLRELQGLGDTPVVLLSARDARAQRVEGFELGADDYITKPFSPQELVSRIRAIVQRRELDRSYSRHVRQLKDLELDFEDGAVLSGGTRIALTQSELRLLGLLAERPGEVVSRREILEHLWHSDFVGDERAGDIHVSNLRRKLGPQAIETVRGRGYRLRA